MTLSLSLSPAFNLTRDVEPIPLKNKKAQALLAYLALTGQPHSREHLATLLWGDRFDEQARNSLRQALFALRKAVGEDVVTGDDPLALAEGGLALKTGLDLLRGFQTGAEGFDTWLEAERSRWRDRAATDRAKNASEATVGGDYATAITLWSQALALDPVNEAFQRGLMQAMAAEGRRADALASYTRFSERLNAELDITPSQETAALANEIRAGQDAKRNTDASSDVIETQAKAHALIAPFTDLGGGDLAGFFASELPTEINFRARAINLVSILPAETQSASFSDDVNLLDAAIKRGAESIISGSARQIGEKIRVSTSLLSVKENAVVWDDSRIVDEADAFESIGRVATSVTQSLARHSGGLRTALEQMSRLGQFLDDPAAFENEVSNFVWYAFFIEHNRENQLHYLKTMEMAAERYPNSTNLLAWYAYTLFHTGHLQDAPDRVDWYKRAAKVAERAVVIDPGHELALGARIFTNSWLGNFKVVDQANDTLVAKDSPFHVRAGIYAVSLIFRGRLEEALPYLTRAIELERGTPLLFYRYSILGLGHFMAGDFDTALVAAENALTIGTEFYLTHLVRAAALERLGRHEDAEKAIADMRKEFVDPRLSHYDFLPITDQASKADFFNALSEAGFPD